MTTLKNNRVKLNSDSIIKAIQFEVVHFMETDERDGKVKPRLLLYALGENGIVYEMSGGNKWLALPIDSNKIRKLEDQ
jgi:hypothetical protein